MSRSTRLPALDPDFAPERAVLAGVAASIAYLVVMYADMKVSGSRSDDLLMVGRPLTPDPRRARLLGLLAHTSFGVTVGLAYGAYFHRRLRGPNWARGMQLLLTENAVIWPLTFFIDRFDPAMRTGEIPRLNSPVPAAQQIARHVGYGIVLGLVYGNGHREIDR